MFPVFCYGAPMAPSTPENPEYSKGREFKVILEDIQSQFRVFGEGLEILTEKFENLAATVKTLPTKTEMRAEIKAEIKAAVEPLATKTDFARMFNVLNDHETRLSVLEKRH